ncbi:hypothetical protein, partial [Mesorhizobium sp. M0910]|uniref:hypothetical protein n=1 Tax=Mesorhizobium sp. M0910 TaxID=2957025 RepID=UPI003336FFBD
MSVIVLKPGSLDDCDDSRDDSNFGMFLDPANEGAFMMLWSLVPQGLRSSRPLLQRWRGFGGEREMAFEAMLRVIR